MRDDPMVGRTNPKVKRYAPTPSGESLVGQPVDQRVKLDIIPKKTSGDASADARAK